MKTILNQHSYISYEEYLKMLVNKTIYKHGGLRRASKYYGVDPAVFSRIINGKYTPRIETAQKWFPELNNIETILMIVKKLD